MANMANHVQVLRAMVSEQSAFFQTQAAAMPDMFNPEETEVDNSGLETGGAVLATLNVFITLVPHLQAVSAGLDVVTAALPLFEQDEPYVPGTICATPAC
jgi:hypothetical protein